MQTPTVTKARPNLGGRLNKAAAGEEIGVIVGDQIIAFRKVAIVAADYASTEYGLSASEVDAAAARIPADVRSAETVEYQPGMLSPVKVQLTKRFLGCVRNLSAADAKAVDDALAELLGTFGRPHADTGASARLLRPPVYELRVSLALRIGFVRAGEALLVEFVGNHSEVSAYLRNSR